MRIAILYVFHQLNKQVKYFLRHGIIHSDQYDYYFIYNGEENIDQHFVGLNLMYRENKGFDFGGWSDALFRLAHGSDRLIKDSYQYYIFMNSSVSGPFVPTYCHREWPLFLIELLNNQTVLSGISINCDKWIYPGDVVAHVQSMLFCVDSVTLQFLIEKEIFHPTKFLSLTHKNQLVKECEVRMSDEVLSSGKNIACLMKIYQNVDFRHDPIPYKLGDPWYVNAIMGHNLHPYETIFFKNNRDITSGMIDQFMEYHDRLLTEK